MFIGGLDLGQSGDPTALAINEVVGEPAVHMVRDLFRWPLGTPYTDIVEDVHTFWREMRLGDSLLCIDYTGCGRPVVDLFLRRAEIPVRAICITSGSVSTETEYGWNVPKRDLAVVMAILMRLRRFQVAEGIGEEAAMLMKELQNFRVEITKAGHETYECLVGGTKVATDRGDVLIKDIVAGDRVLTRKGYRRVLWSGATKRVNDLTMIQLNTGEKIVGTGDHQVWTRNRGWLELRCVGQHDELLSQAGVSCQQQHPTPRLSSSTDSSTARAGSKSISCGRGTDRKTCSCIGRCGLPTTGQSPTATTSTTRTATRRTTTSPIWSACPSNSTARRTSLEGFGPASSAGPCSLESLARAITALSLAGREASGPCRCPALAAADLSLRSMPPRCSALRSAARPTATPTVGHVADASGAASSSSRSTRCPSSVRAVAPPVIVSSSNAEPVYDLMVEDQHEFFANGVLVHNSWRSGQHDDLVLAAAMACWYAERGCLGAFDAGSGALSSRSLTADLDDIRGEENRNSGSVLDRSF